MNKIYKILVAFILVFSFAGSCSNDDSPLENIPAVAAVIVNFKVDGVDYKGVIGPEAASPDAKCTNGKTTAFVTTDTKRIVNLLNFVRENTILVDPSTPENLPKCNFVVSLVIKGADNSDEVLNSKSGTWTYSSDKKFSFNASLVSSKDQTVHTIEASGTLK